MREIFNLFVGLSLVLLLFNAPLALAYNLTYDANGNLVQDKNHRYEYNEFDQLIKINSTNGDILEEYAYDFEGNRIRKIQYVGGTNITTYYIDENFIRVVNSSGTYDEIYYHDSTSLVGLKSGSEKRYYHQDHIGSVNIITNQAGDSIETTTYLPFGATLSGETDRFSYGGKEKDSVGLHYFGARYYDSSTVHFTQPDNFIQDQYNPQNLNRFSYVLNNPYRYVDEDGNYATAARIALGYVWQGILAISGGITLLDVYEDLNDLLLYETKLNLEDISSYGSTAVEEFGKIANAPKLVKAGSVVGVVQNTKEAFENQVFSKFDSDSKPQSTVSSVEKSTAKSSVKKTKSISKKKESSKKKSSKKKKSPQKSTLEQSSQQPSSNEQKQKEEVIVIYLPFAPSYVKIIEH